MPFDIVLPSVVSIVTIAIVLLYIRFEPKLKTLFEEKEFQIRDVIFLVVAMGAMIAVIVFVPQQAIQVLFLGAYSFVLFLFTYVAVERWYVAILSPVIFVVLYLSDLWGLLLLNFFAIAFVIMISVYMGGVFSWKTVLVFAGALTVMDVIQVFGTGAMVEAAKRLVELKLPIMVFVDTFPRDGGIGLGLGDMFLAGLLAIQTMKKFDKKAGIISGVAIGFAFFVYEVLVFYYEYYTFFPATLVVVAGWLLGLGIHGLFRRQSSS